MNIIKRKSLIKPGLGLFFILLSLMALALTSKADDFDTKRIKMWETSEWSIQNDSWDGNPFDLSAEVSFVHSSDSKEHKTKMFYAGNKMWKFRFTGTLLGEWHFTTASSDKELNKLSGKVIVKENPDEKIKGFLTHKGNKFAIWTENIPELRAYRFMVYMNEKEFRNFDNKLGDKPWSQSPFLQFSEDARLNAYLKDADDNGFDIVYVHPGYPHVWTDGSNPRFETFDLLDKIIKTAHAKGMRVHVWMWGDDARKATPKGLGTKGRIYRKLQKFLPDQILFGNFGINGPEDQRLQRYISARLGPLPGWSMGYGFDLHEWISEKQLNIWASFLHSEMGWDHLLAARGFVLKGKNNINSYDGFGRSVPLKTTEHGPKDYQEIVEDLNGDKNHPHLYEERHSYKREHFNLDMDGTRRLVWREMMAGGMGGWFGFYTFSEHPYPNPEQLRCAREFWAKNITLDMDVEPSFSDGHALISFDKQYAIFYKENTDIIKTDNSITGMPSNAFAVDTRKAYVEVPLDLADLKKDGIKLPYLSDWIISVKNK